jgi:quercetin dioxygenase-like cupin family protein
MVAYDLGKLVKFSPKAHTKYVFFESTKLKAQVMGLEPGQQIPPCKMDHDIIFFVIQGQGKMIVDGQEEAVSESSWIFVPKEKETRSIKAETRMKVLAIQVRC